MQVDAHLCPTLSRPESQSAHNPSGRHTLGCRTWCFVSLWARFSVPFSLAAAASRLCTASFTSATEYAVLDCWAAQQQNGPRAHRRMEEATDRQATCDVGGERGDVSSQHAPRLRATKYPWSHEDLHVVEAVDDTTPAGSGSVLGMLQFSMQCRHAHWNSCGGCVHTQEAVDLVVLAQCVQLSALQLLLQMRLILLCARDDG